MTEKAQFKKDEKEISGEGEVEEKINDCSYENYSFFLWCCSKKVHTRKPKLNLLSIACYSQQWTQVIT